MNHIADNMFIASDEPVLCWGQTLLALEINAFELEMNTLALETNMLKMHVLASMMHTASYQQISNNLC